MEESGRPLQMVGGSFNKQGNLHRRLVLGGLKISNLIPPDRVIKIYIEALAGFGHVYCPGGLNNTLLFQDCVLDEAPTVGTEGRMHMLRAGELMVVQVPLIGCVLDNLLQHQYYWRKSWRQDEKQG